MRAGSGEGGSERPPSARVCDAACAGFALFTLSSHAAVAMGASLRQLLLLFAAALALALTLARALRRRELAAAEPGAVSPAPPLAPPPGVPLARPAFDRRVRIAGLAFGLLVALSVARHRDVVELWWGMAVLLAAAGVLLAAEGPPPVEAPARGRGCEGLLWLLGLGAALLTLVVHRPDLDDSFYLNVAVAAADFPERALLAGDTLHGIPGLPLHQPIYRVQSYEILLGALSFLTGIPAIACFHWIAATLAALLVPLAWAELFRLLTPRTWIWSVAALLLVLVAAGETHRFYSNFAFVRMWQGKSIYLFAALPLVYTQALRFALRPGVRRLLWLAAAQVAAVGLSSSALWAAPLGALLCMACALRPTPRGVAVLALGALASAWVLGVGWWLMQGDIAAHDPLLERARARALRSLPPPPGKALAEALESVLGSGRLHLVALAAVAAGWACQPRGLARRFALVLPLGVWLVLLNPYLERWLTNALTGPSYWRVFWTLPIPALLALVLTAPLQWEGSPGRRRAGRAAAAVLCLAFAGGVPRYSALAAENRPAEVRGELRLGWPDLKVPRSDYRSDYEWAAALNQSVPAGAVVLAPEYVAGWVPTFHHHATPLVAREAYLRKFLDLLGQPEVRQRRVMARYAGGQELDTGAAERFRDGLGRFRVAAVVLAITERTAEARSILTQAGFERRLEGAEHELWVRP
jgi:hypothetical protein